MGYIRRSESVDFGKYKICVSENKFEGDITIITTDLALDPNSASDRPNCCVPVRVDLRGTVTTECKCAPAMDYYERVVNRPAFYLGDDFGADGGNIVLGDARNDFEIPYNDVPEFGTQNCPRTEKTTAFGDTVIKGWCGNPEIPDDIIRKAKGVPLRHFFDSCPEKVVTKDINISIDLIETFAGMPTEWSDRHGTDKGPPFDNLDEQGCPCEHVEYTGVLTPGIPVIGLPDLARPGITVLCKNSEERYICLMTTLGCDQFEGGPNPFEVANIVRWKLQEEGAWDLCRIY